MKSETFTFACYYDSPLGRMEAKLNASLFIAIMPGNFFKRKNFARKMLRTGGIMNWKPLKVSQMTFIGRYWENIIMDLSLLHYQSIASNYSISSSFTNENQYT